MNTISFVHAKDQAHMPGKQNANPVPVCSALMQGACDMINYFDKAIVPVAWISMIAIMVLGLLIY